MKIFKFKFIIPFLIIITISINSVFAINSYRSRTTQTSETYQFSAPERLLVPNDLDYKTYTDNGSTTEKVLYNIGESRIYVARSNLVFRDLIFENFYSYYGHNSFLYDSLNNPTKIKMYAKIKILNKANTLVKTYWANLSLSDTISIPSNSTSYQNPYSYIIIEYYFGVSDISNLNVGTSNWYIKVGLPSIAANLNPNIKLTYFIVRYGDFAYTLSDDYFYDEVIDYNTLYYVDKLNFSDVADSKVLGINVTNLFKSSNIDFFNGNINEYYKIKFSLFKNDFITSDNFSVGMKITSKNQFNVISTEDKSKSVKYNLYLKYYFEGFKNFLIPRTNPSYKILLKDLSSTNNSRNYFILATQSTALDPSQMALGAYTDTIYINFITDGLSINDGYDKIIYF